MTGSVKRGWGVRLATSVQSSAAGVRSQSLGCVVCASKTNARDDTRTGAVLQADLQGCNRQGTVIQPGPEPVAGTTLRLDHELTPNQLPSARGASRSTAPV